MVPLLFLIILVSLYTRLISAIGRTNLSEFAWELYSRVSWSKTSKELRATQRKAIDVYTERTNTSSKDEFAKWARLDREYQTLKGKIERLNGDLNRSKSTFKSAVTGVLFAATTGIKIYFRLRYRKVPVFWLPSSSVPYYIQWVLAIPGCPLGTVSVSMWFAIVDSALASLIHLFKWIYSLGMGTRKEKERKQPTKIPTKTI